MRLQPTAITYRPRIDEDMRSNPTLNDAKRVQAILQGASAPRPVCSQCRVKEEDLPGRMLRCSRCQMSHYCSAKCQKKHFSFHKHSCKSIADLHAHLERGNGSLPIGGKENQRTYETWEMASILSSLGDHLVETGYRETDTIENGSVFYRHALRKYINVLSLDSEAFFDASSPVEDKILLLLVLLGGDEDTIREWMQYTESPRKVYYDEPAIGDQDVTFLMVCRLLVLMRSLAKYRCENPEADEICHRTKKSIQDLVATIQAKGKGRYLIYLRDSIPLNPEDTPELFRGGPGKNNEEVKSTTREFWLLFQDCFFLTPGLNSVLHEFVPEDE
jgi:MYND finger